MAVFKLSFPDLMDLKKKVDSLEGLENKPMIFGFFYYISHHDLYIYLPYDSQVFCTVLVLEQIEDIEAFLLRNLKNARILFENYVPNYERPPVNFITEENPNK